MITLTIISRTAQRVIPIPLKISKGLAVRNPKPCHKVRQSFVCNPTPNMVISCQYSTVVNPVDMIVDYEYTKKATTSPDVLIVDVREPDEIKEHGKIPNSINIPLGNVTTVLSTMSDADFKQAFNRPKPTEDSEIIFYCMIGKRSGMAQQNALNLGFKNVKNYLGSWTDWATKRQ